MILPKDIIDNIYSFLNCKHKGCTMKTVNIASTSFDICIEHQRDIIDFTEIFCIELNYTSLIYLHPNRIISLQLIKKSIEYFDIFDIHHYCGNGICILRKN